MSCNRCNEKYELKECSSKIYFISEYTELMKKSKIFLMKLNIDLHKRHDIKLYIDYKKK